MITETTTKNLQELLEENTGFNPENVAALGGDYELIGNGKVLVVNERCFHRTDALNLKDYIQHFPRQFGLILAGRFFREGDC